MKALLKRIHSPDVPDLRTYRPHDPSKFGFLLQLMIGPDAEEGAESFDLLVCTPAWLIEQHESGDVVWGRHHVIVFKYDLDRLLSAVRAYCDQCEGDTWREVALQVGRIAKWEFEDYNKLV